MTQPASKLVEFHLAGLEALLAAIHADDPKRELLVRVGDAMREAAQAAARITELEERSEAQKAQVKWGSETIERLQAQLERVRAEAWQDIGTAHKDRTPILAKFYDDIFPRLKPGRPDLERWNGLKLVLRHPGIADDGFDIGWSVAAPVGHGGFPDEWVECWMPLPASPAPLKTDRKETT